MTIKEFWKIRCNNQYPTAIAHFFSMVFRGWWAAKIVSVPIETAITLNAHYEQNYMGHDLQAYLEDWSKNNLKGRWKPNNGYWWEFELEEDANAFEEKWG